MLDPFIPNEVFYQLNYCWIWCLRLELNQRHADFQSAALPTELQRHMVRQEGLEPSTHALKGRYSTS